MARWSVAEAKARLSEVIARAQADGPQVITRNGTEAVVMISAEEWRAKTRRKGSLAEFLLASPLRAADLSIERSTDDAREVDLGRDEP